MSPKPYTSLHEMLARGDELSAEFPPYDIYMKDKAVFLTFASNGSFISFPLLALGKASLRDCAATIVLVFGKANVQIKGSKLGDLYEDILLGKVRVIRTGRHPSCTVEKISIAETATI